MEYQLNLRRIGVMIHHYRLRRLNSYERNDFRQDGFLSSSIRYPFFDIQPGYPVCSRATLLKLENGKDIREEELYRFFLHKLDLSYVYSPYRERQYKACFSAFDAIITNGSLEELDRFVLPDRTQNNLLYGFYDRLLISLYQFYTKASYPSIDTMREFIELWLCVPLELRPITQIFILSAYYAHPFYDHIVIKPILCKFPSHPLEILACSVMALAKERYLLSEGLMERFDKTGCSGELPVFLQGLIRGYTSRVLSHPADPANIIVERSSHPINMHCRQTLIFLLGKHAIEQDRSKHAMFYFGMLDKEGEPFGIFAALILNRNYIGDAPLNPKLQCLSDYQEAKKSKCCVDKLVFLMTKVLPAMGERERFILLFLRSDVIALVRRTQRYKAAYVYLSRLYPLKQPLVFVD